MGLGLVNDGHVQAAVAPHGWADIDLPQGGTTRLGCQQTHHPDALMLSAQATEKIDWAADGAKLVLPYNLHTAPPSH